MTGVGRDESFAGVADEVAPCDVAVTTSASALQKGDGHGGQLWVNGDHQAASQSCNALIVP
jgi:hypothetical protein